MGLNVNTSTNMGINAVSYQSAGGAKPEGLSGADQEKLSKLEEAQKKLEENREKLEEMQEKFESIRSSAKDMEEYAEEAPRAAKQMILSSMCRQVEAMNPRIYSAKTWNALMKAYGSAKQLLNEDAPTEKQLEKAMQALRKALARLESVERRKQKEEDKEREGLPIITKQPGKGGEEAAAEQAVVDRNIKTFGQE